jgi:hypothetical protein
MVHSQRHIEIGQRVPAPSVTKGFLGDRGGELERGYVHLLHAPGAEFRLGVPVNVEQPELIGGGRRHGGGRSPSAAARPARPRPARSAPLPGLASTALTQPPANGADDPATSQVHRLRSRLSGKCRRHGDRGHGA